jgi:AbrB family looped-hinge helix DNA binding protein
MMVVVLREKSQITLPKEIVDSLKLKKGDYLDVTIEDGKIIITPVLIINKFTKEVLEIG